MDKVRMVQVIMAASKVIITIFTIFIFLIIIVIFTVIIFMIVITIANNTISIAIITIRYHHQGDVTTLRMLHLQGRDLSLGDLDSRFNLQSTYLKSYDADHHSYHNTFNTSSFTSLQDSFTPSTHHHFVHHCRTALNLQYIIIFIIAGQR